MVVSGAFNYNQNYSPPGLIPSSHGRSILPTAYILYRYPAKIKLINILTIVLIVMKMH